MLAAASSGLIKSSIEVNCEKTSTRRPSLASSRNICIRAASLPLVTAGGASASPRDPESAFRITASFCLVLGATSGVDQLDLADRSSAGCGQLCGALDYSDRQHLALAADLDLMQRTPGKVEPGPRHGLIGDNEFAGKVFGQAFESARGVDGIADRGDRGGIAIAHLSDNGRPAMNADTDTQRPIEFAPQRSVQFVEARGNKPGGGERLSAAGMGAALDPEQRHDAVADELVDASSRRFDRSSHRCEIAVENEHHVIGKPAFGERGEAANVDEQDRNLALAALRKVDSAPPVHGMRKRWQQRRHS